MVKPQLLDNGTHYRVGATQVNHRQYFNVSAKMLGEWSLPIIDIVANVTLLLSGESQSYTAAQGKAIGHCCQVAELKWWYIFTTVRQSIGFLALLVNC